MYDKFIHFLPCAISKRMIIIEQSLNMVFFNTLVQKAKYLCPTQNICHPAEGSERATFSVQRWNQSRK